MRLESAPRRFRPRTRSLALRRARLSGFTLVELMVVVVITAALAITAITVMRSHVDSSRSIEGLTMVQSIRAAQERYRAEHGLYLNVSQQGGFYPDDPSPAGVGQDKRNFFHALGDDSHPDNARWLELLPTVSGTVRFGYLTNAGLPGEVMTEPAYAVPNLVWPTVNEPWYVIQAVSDLDEDGSVGFFVGSSLNGEVFRHNEGE